MVSQDLLDPIDVDLWSTGYRGDIVQRPLVEALKHDIRIAPRAIYCGQSPGLSGMAGLKVPNARTAGTKSVRLIPALIPDILAARRNLKTFYADEQHRRIVHITMESAWDHFYLDIPKHAGAKLLLVIHDAIFHEGEESRLLMALRARLLRMVDAVALLSPYAADTFARTTRYDGPIHVVTPGLLMDSSPPGPAKVPPVDGVKRFLFFGRMHEYKGLGVLLDAWCRFKAMPGAARATLSIIGSGPLERHLPMIAGAPDVSLEHGWVSDERMSQAFATHHVNLLPYSEGSESATALAGMWAGMPAIATDIPCFAGKFTDRQNALLTARNANDIARAIATLAADDVLFAKLAKGTHEAAKQWSAPRVAARWIELYASLRERG